MADPSIRLSNSAVAASGSDLAIGITGTPADGELILFIQAANCDPTFPTLSLSGFTEIAKRVDADFRILYMWGKIASGEGTNPTYTSSHVGATLARSCGVVLVFQNANSSLPTNAVTNHDTSSDTTFNFSALTTTKDGSYDLVVVSHDGNVGSSANNYSSWGTSLSELFDFKDGGSGYAGIGVAGVTRASAGSQSATTVTSNASDKSVAIRVEVEPAAAAGGQPTQKRAGGVPWMGQHGAGFPSAIQRWIRRESGLQVPAYYRERRAA